MNLATYMCCIVYTARKEEKTHTDTHNYPCQQREMVPPHIIINIHDTCLKQFHTVVATAIISNSITISTASSSAKTWNVICIVYVHAHRQAVQRQTDTPTLSILSLIILYNE